MDSHDPSPDVFFSANTSPVRPASAAPSIEITTTEDSSCLETSRTSFSNSPSSVYANAATGFCFCGNPSEGRCSGCDDTPGHRNTYYCSKECQATDQPRHVQMCKSLNTLRTLHRASISLQEIFYMYRAKLFDRPVAKIDKTEAEGYIRLVICEGRVTQPTNDLQYLHKLPCKLFGEEDQDDEDNENEDKRAILAHSASAQSLVWMHDLIGYFLADVAFAISEQRVTPIYGKRSVVSVDCNKQLDLATSEHFILAITLKNAAGTFALDLCGAQYGFYDTLTRFDEYKARGIANAAPLQFGNHESIRYSVDCLRRERTRRGALTRVNLQTSQKLVSGAVEWEKEYGTRISTMLQASTEVFENRKEGLLHYLAYEIQERLDKMAEEVAPALDARARSWYGAVADT
ncbi:hypothetical protein BKA61DRAFT_333305 [Leptodontidium sp. MPI-SDFR-AT-0119]|nr:hypothetical protein BKA61DRAFT_333305 [Leptodontidium sp. MPI-SDFR-AT-0119]